MDSNQVTSRDSENNEIATSSEIRNPTIKETNIDAVTSGNRKNTAEQRKNSTNSVKESSNDIVQSVRQVNISEQINIPILGYEVMEERARFTIYKLKVVDNKRGLSWLVFRRYTDFVRLHARLQSERPGAAPRLPAKRWLRDNFDAAFLEERARGLQVFVNTLIRRMSDDPRVREFFCLEDPPQGCTYQPEVQAVYGALEDSIDSLKTQLQHKENIILRLQRRVESLEQQRRQCCCDRTAQ